MQQSIERHSVIEQLFAAFAAFHLMSRLPTPLIPAAIVADEND